MLLVLGCSSWGLQLPGSVSTSSSLKIVLVYLDRKLKDQLKITSCRLKIETQSIIAIVNQSTESISKALNMEKEAKKEAFRKYLESSGVLDALTKVLVALYEQNDKPSSALEFVQQKLGGPTISEYEKLKAEKSDLLIKHNELLASHAEICKELDRLRNSQTAAAERPSEKETF